MSTHSRSLDDRSPSLEGHNLLVTGPPMAGKAAYAVEHLPRGTQRLLVTTTRSAPRLLGEASLDPGVVPAVDCTPGETTARSVTNVSSPGDLTGIDIPVSRFLAAADRPALAFDSLSSLLMYADEVAVFRFLNVLTSRVRDADGTGLYTLDPASHGTATVRKLV